MLPSVLTDVPYKGITHTLWKLWQVQSMSLTWWVTVLVNWGSLQAESSNFTRAPKKQVSCQLVSEWLDAEWIQIFEMLLHFWAAWGAWGRCFPQEGKLSQHFEHWPIPQNNSQTGAVEATVSVCKVWCKVFGISKICSSAVSRKIQSSQTRMALWDIVLYVESFSFHTYSVTCLFLPNCTLFSEVQAQDSAHWYLIKLLLHQGHSWHEENQLLAHCILPNHCDDIEMHISLNHPCRSELIATKQ